MSIELNKIVAVSASVAKMNIRNKDGGIDNVTLTRSKAIKYFCQECQGWELVGVKECTSLYCPLFAYRFGGSVLAAIKKTEDILTKKDAPKKIRKPRAKKVK